MAAELSPLYPIFDAAYLPGSIDGMLRSSSQQGAALPGDVERQEVLTRVAQSLAAAGVTMLQYRNKHEDDAQVLRDATWLRQQAPASLRIILNDRAHLVRESSCDGVHIGQTDLDPEAARVLIGPERILGVSTHNEAQLIAADLTTADYLAIGPVYATGSKLDAEAVVGLAGVRQARALTHKPLVAIGGITLARAADVRAAGADSLAVISALFGPAAAPLEKLAKDFLAVFR
jgi:thiamine-phosphate pyrophosphorylase